MKAILSVLVLPLTSVISAAENDPNIPATPAPGVINSQNAPVKAPGNSGLTEDELLDVRANLNFGGDE